MEFVGGQSLDKLLSQDDHKLPVETALQLTLELAEALDCAHGQGVVHRDLKPANILLTEDGHAKIADFGVAKLNLANHTLGGRALGTPAYMSPEQLNGEAVDGRSDLFSLGVVLYTILTGYRPFQGNSAITVSFKVVNRDPVPATVLDTELPQGLDYIIARAMAKDPAERYQRGMEMVLDIQHLQQGREPWSKAKLPSSPTGGSAGQTAKERAKSPPGQPAIAGKLLQNTRALSLGRGAENLLEVRKRYLPGALLLAGLFILGVWVISFGSRRERPRAAEPLPLAGAVAPVVTAPAPIGKSVKAVPAGSPVSPATSPATLEIEVEHKFAEANLSIWVDGRLTYTHRLEGTDKKHLVVFHHVQGHEFHAVQVSPGKHSLRVQVTSDEATYDRSATVAGEFASGQESVLRINFDKHGEMKLSLQ
jgi:serine/threonine-protein kinase